MAKLFNGSINFPSAMKPTGAQPLDDRAVVDAFSALTDNSTFGGAKYDGMIVAVVEDQKAYMLVDSDNSTLPESWVCLGANADVNVDDEYINQLIESYLSDNDYATKDDITVKDVRNGGTSLIGENGVVDLSNTYYTKEQIEDKFSNFELFEVVLELPKDSIEYNKVYIVASDNTGKTNSFKEFIRIKGEDGSEDSWEKLGEFKTNVDLSNYVTNDKLNTNEVKLSSDIEENYTKGESVQEILISLNSRIKAINSSIDSALSGGVTSIQEGSGITVDDSTSTSPKVSINIHEQADNAVEIIDNKLYVKNLEDRLALLESLLSAFTGDDAAEFVTNKNIGEHAITSISYGNDTNDIIVIKDGTTGAVTLELDSITNIAYGDAEIMSEN